MVDCEAINPHAHNPVMKLFNGILFQHGRACVCKRAHSFDGGVAGWGGAAVEVSVCPGVAHARAPTHREIRSNSGRESHPLIDAICWIVTLSFR